MKSLPLRVVSQIRLGESGYYPDTEILNVSGLNGGRFGFGERTVDPASAEDSIFGVANDGLAGSYSVLWLIKRDLDSVLGIASAFDVSGNGRAVVAKLGHARELIIDTNEPIHSRSLQRLGRQVIFLPDEDFVGGRVDFDNEVRFAHGDPQTFALSDGKPLDAWVIADRLTVESLDLTGG